MLSGHSLAVQLSSLDEVVYSTLRSRVEVPHDHTQSVAIALAHNVIHDIQQRPQLRDLQSWRRGWVHMNRKYWANDAARTKTTTSRKAPAFFSEGAHTTYCLSKVA